MNEIRVEVAAKEEWKNAKIATVPRNHSVPRTGLLLYLNRLKPEINDDKPKRSGCYRGETRSPGA